MISFDDGSWPFRTFEHAVWVYGPEDLPPLQMTVPYVLVLAHTYYHAIHTQLFTLAPRDNDQHGVLIRYGLASVVEELPPALDFHLDVYKHPALARLELTWRGVEILSSIPCADLVDALVNCPFTPSSRWYSIDIGHWVRISKYEIAASFMHRLTAAELPQFLSSEVEYIREKAQKLLTKMQFESII